MVLCTRVLFSCEKELIIPEEPDEPVMPGELPSIDNIINFNNEFMIVGANKNVCGVASPMATGNMWL